MAEVRMELYLLRCLSLSVERKPLSERRNIVVMADEAHRGQYGFDEKIVMSENENGEKEAHTVIGNARVIHDALPNATFHWIYRYTDFS